MQERFDDQTLKLIRERVKRLIGRHGFTASDRDDLEQDVVLHVLECLRRQQQLIEAPEGFFRKVIADHAVTLIRRRQAEKRDHRRLSSLHEMVLDEDGEYVERARIIPEDHAQSRLGTDPRDRLEGIELAHDVAAVLATLPTDLRDLCERLKDHSVAEAARQLGVPRRTLRDAIGRLRQHFEEAGLRDYLGR